VTLMAAGLGHSAAKALSFVAGTTTAYLINRRWTFRATPSRRRFVAVVVLYALTFALQVGLFSLLFTYLTRAGLSTLTVQVVAFVVAQGVATTVNFVVQRAVIFRLR
jgi:putative flippase GtrA